MIRAVFGTNILVSGLLWKGPPHHLLRLVDDGKVYLCLNESMLEEFADVIRRTAFASRLEQLDVEPEQLVALVVEKAHLFEDVSVPPTIKGDPDDDRVLACAIASHASYIVTGDRLLLNQGYFGNARIIAPATAVLLFSHHYR
jgi:putative PIN family toxin of toxin-antitoxin system